MQRPDERKRKLITDTAARLFATRPFDKVRLDDIAAEARLGKGTLYVYFDSKEDLYFSLIYEGFAALVDRLTAQIDPPRDAPPAGGRGGRPRNGRNGHPAAAAGGPPAPLSPTECLERIVTELVAFALQHPHFFELMRAVGIGQGRAAPQFRAKRQELNRLIGDTLRRGVAAGEMCDPRPELTAACIPGFVRSMILFGGRGVDERTMIDQILHLLRNGIVKRKAKAKAKAPAARGAGVR